MVNYNGVQEILDSGTDNMEVLVNNVSHDDDTLTIDGVDWFKFGGAAAQKIYVSGNSWIGFGSNSLRLNVNQRDAKLYYLYREEGSIYGFYKFLKLRWHGYSQYNNSTEQCSLIYDVILWETGCISVHMVHIPSTYYNGVFSLASTKQVKYTAPTEENPDFYFTPIDEDGNEFIAYAGMIPVQLPFDTRYLIRSCGKLYTVASGALKEVDATELNADTFLDNGIEMPPDSNIMKQLVNPELLFWQDSDIPCEIEIKVTGVPQIPQYIYSSVDTLLQENVIGIEKATAEASEDVMFAITFDGGVTYHALSEDGWVETSEQFLGVTTKTLNEITPEQWAEIVQLGEYYFRVALPSQTSHLNSLVVTYKMYEEVTA